MLGEDVDKTYEEVEASRKTDIIESRRIIVKSIGPSIHDVQVHTSDGIDLLKYGVVAIAWDADAERGCTQLTVVFGDVAIELEHPFVLTTIADTRCTCDLQHWNHYIQTQHNLDNHKSVDLPCDNLYITIQTHGKHHAKDCPRFVDDQEPETDQNRV